MQNLLVTPNLKTKLSMSFHILTVEPLNNGNYRLGLSNSDFNNLPQQLDGQDVFISLPNINMNIQVTHDTFYNHGKLFHIAISEWIIQNEYNIYDPGMPYKLIFVLRNSIFTYYLNQAH
jgi:hypothetical protein